VRSDCGQAAGGPSGVAALDSARQSAHLAAAGERACLMAQIKNSARIPPTRILNRLVHAEIRCKCRCLPERTCGIGTKRQISTTS
jgi:hypothetical protein